jgi:hypothetical protein
MVLPPHRYSRASPLRSWRWPRDGLHFGSRRGPLSPLAAQARDLGPALGQPPVREALGLKLRHNASLDVFLAAVTPGSFY